MNILMGTCDAFTRAKTLASGDCPNINDKHTLAKTRQPKYLLLLERTKGIFMEILFWNGKRSLLEHQERYKFI